MSVTRLEVEVGSGRDTHFKWHRSIQSNPVAKISSGEATVNPSQRIELRWSSEIQAEDSMLGPPVRPWFGPWPN